MEKSKYMKFKAILAMDEKYGIGKDNMLPWHSPEDLKWFKKNTLNDIVVMGYNTWESIGCKPLPDRINVVITSRKEVEGDCDVIISGNVQYVMEHLIKVGNMAGKDTIWFIGGSKLFSQFMPFCDEIYVTYMHKDYGCNIFLDKKLLEPFSKHIYMKRLDNLTFAVMGKPLQNS